MRKLLSLLLALALFPCALSARAESAAPDAGELARGLLSGQAAKQKDPWVLAILEAGAKNASVSGGALRFSLRGFNPDPDALGSFSGAEDPQRWLARFWENYTAWNLEITVPLTAEGAIKKNAPGKFLSAVKKAAGEAKKALAGKDAALALSSLLFCSPTDEKKVFSANLLTVTDRFAAFIAARADVFPCENPAEWAPVFYPQRNAKYGTAGGPHALTLTWEGPDPDVLVRRAYDAAALELASVPAAKRSGRSVLPVLWRGKLAESSVALSREKLPSHTLTIDLDDLAAGKVPAEYAAFFAAYAPARAYEKLDSAYELLPEEACLEVPGNGVFSSASRGKTVQVSVPEGGRCTYVQFRDAGTGELRADAFIHPGKDVSVRIPGGSYVLQFASGVTWYGTERLFGPLGDYTASDPVTVAAARWKIVSETESEGFTLHPSDPSAFGVR